MPIERLRKLGEEKATKLTEEFDLIYDEYKKKALTDGYEGEIRFIHEHGRVFIYVVL